MVTMSLGLPKYGMCKYCAHFGPLTKAGVLRRHGYKHLVRRRTWHGFDLVSGYEAPIRKKPCPGSGLTPIIVDDLEGSEP